MSNRLLYILWAVLYALCAGLGFIPAPEGFLFGLLVFCSLVFFLPPAILLYRAAMTGDKQTPKKIRVIAIIWLIVTTCTLCLNILSVALSAQAGRVLHAILVLLSAPMVCGQYWVIGLFLWACLLFVSWQFCPKKTGRK